MTLQGNFLDYFLVFGAGILLSFSPCVYPLLPVTIGIISSKSGNSKLKGFLLSLIYVLGLAVTYSALGLIAALSGRLFGSITQRPLTYFIVGNIFIIFGLSSLGVFNIKGVASKMPEGVNKNGIFPVFLLGLFSGLVVSPCVSPALGAILTYVGTRQNIFYGASLLFIFALGLGFVLILAGTFSAILGAIPKSGKWMYWIKRISGIILIASGEYFLIRAGGLLP
ncbi:MAG: cytochrome c biogenesis protein CcdA [Candidatus Omnitrophota bacterium]